MKCPILENVGFSNNSFSGELLHALCSGLAVKIFIVIGNNFTGPLPNCLRNCSGLTRVRLDGNKLSGNIFEAFVVHPNLVFISLSGNEFTGEL